jgi:S-DNA-T family DNA segregation ATPase FtsK/SpoIIIE
MGEINIGPTVTQYTLKPAEGIKVSKLLSLQRDLALALAAHPIRMEAPIPGKSLVGIEVPNQKRAEVRLSDLLNNKQFFSSGPLVVPIGKDVMGEPYFANIERMPHLLVAGATGTGKTVCLNSLVLSLLWKNSPETVRFVMIDPKRVEFTLYKNLPHLLCPPITNVSKVIPVIKWLIEEMEERFGILHDAGQRDIISYNESVERQIEKAKKSDKKGDNIPQKLPYIIVIIDELADIMAAKGKEFEAGVVRLAQMSRATGIHLILATQRPSVEVLTGLIKANITCRIAFQVASQVDSRTVLDMAGAEKLLGRGDMLFLSSESGKPKRLQCAYVSAKEVKRVVDYLQKTEKEFDTQLIESLAETLEKVSESESSG